MEFLNDHAEQIIKFIWPLIYILIGMIVYEFIKGALKRAENKAFTKKHHEKRAKTVSRHILNITKYIIIIIIGIATLSNFGVNVTSIIAGLGITAALIGLAFQDFVKDLISGITIIMEDQYEIGDFIELNGFMGEVVEIGLRTTRVRNYNGKTLIIANHNITEIINYNLAKNIATIEVSVAYEEDLDRVENVISKLSKVLREKYSNIKKDIQIIGVNELDTSSIVYKIGIETSTTDYFSTQRILRREIKQLLEKEKIKIPYQQVEVHNGK